MSDGGTKPFESILSVKVFEWLVPMAGVPNPGPWTGTGPRPVRNQATEQQVSGGQVSEVSLALPPEPRLLSPPTSREKMIFHETSPWCRKGWELLP